MYAHTGCEENVSKLCDNLYFLHQRLAKTEPSSDPRYHCISKDGRGSKRHRLWIQFRFLKFNKSAKCLAAMTQSQTRMFRGKISKGAGKKRFSATAVKFRQALQIRTATDGYNSGRTYYLQAGSDEQRADVVNQLTLQVWPERGSRRARRRFAGCTSSPHARPSSRRS
jgi:hypothetical protein